MTSQIQKNNPFVSVVVNKTDIPFIINGFKGIVLNTMEKIVLEENDTIGYLQRSFDNTESELIRIQFHVEDELPILLAAIKSKSFLKATPVEKTQLQLDTLIDLIQELPKQYKQQIIAKKIELI